MTEQNNIVPVVQSLDERVTELEQTNQTLLDVVSNLLERFPHVEVGVTGLLNDQIDRFENERDGQGHLAHPCFADMRQMMGELIAGGHCRGLKDSYAKAMEINLNDFNS